MGTRSEVANEDAPLPVTDDGRRYRFIETPVPLKAGWLGSVTLDSGEVLFLGARRHMAKGSYGFVVVGDIRGRVSD